MLVHRRERRVFQSEDRIEHICLLEHKQLLLNGLGDCRGDMNPKEKMLFPHEWQMTIVPSSC